MSENGSDNGNGNDSKGAGERDEFGRFLPGGPGGPGRGKKKPITLSEIENALQDDLKSDDAKIRHNATKLLLVLKKAQLNETDEDKPSLLDPRLKTFLQTASSGITDDSDVQDVVDNEDDNILK